MVWQLPDNDNSTSADILDKSSSHSLTSLPLSSPSLSLGAQTPESSSLEIGPTPGSGMALDSHSESMSNHDTESDTETVHSVSLRNSTVSPDFDRKDAASFQDPLVWSAEVESMLNNPPPSKFESFNLSGDPSLSSWVVPPPVADVKETLNSVCVPKTSISPVNEIDEGSDLQHNPSHSPSPYSLSTIEPQEDFTGHIVGSPSK